MPDEQENANAMVPGTTNALASVLIPDKCRKYLLVKNNALKSDSIPNKFRKYLLDKNNTPRSDSILNKFRNIRLNIIVAKIMSPKPQCITIHNN